MIFGAIQGGLSIAEMGNLEFHAEQSLELAENGAKKIYIYSEQQFCRQNGLLMKEIKWDWSKLIGRWQ